MGEWIKTTYEEVAMKNYAKYLDGEVDELIPTTFTRYTCDVCKYSTGEIAKDFNYCPICGDYKNLT